jgi:hypothetical protein
VIDFAKFTRSPLDDKKPQQEIAVILTVDVVNDRLNGVSGNFPDSQRLNFSGVFSRLDVEHAVMIVQVRDFGVKVCQRVAIQLVGEVAMHF